MRHTTRHVACRLALTSDPLQEQLSALPPLKTESATRRKTSSQPAEAAEVDAIKVDAIKVDAIKRDMIKELFLHELAAVTQRLTEAVHSCSSVVSQC